MGRKDCNFNSKDLDFLNKYGLLGLRESMLDDVLFIGDKSYKFSEIIELRERGDK